MLHKKEAFTTFLSIELEDLHEDIDLLIKQLKEKFNHQTITHYVFLENVCTLKSELFGVESIYEYIKNLDTNAYGTLDELHSAVRGELTRRIKEAGLPDAVIYFIDRKIAKVSHYLENS
jgi:hypothetical protein